VTEYKINSGLVFQKETGGEWKQVDFYPTPNQGGDINPKFFVIHFTAGRLDAHGTAQFFQKPSAKTSAHLNLSADGTLTQNVSLEKKAWHAGKSKWGGVSNLNNHSIGIEVCNPGPLEKTSKGWKAWFGKIYDDPEIIEAPHPNNPTGPVYGWLPFTEEQVEVLLNLGHVIHDEFDIIETVGHDMISPGRKFDPGPCMSTNVYRQLNGGSRDDVDEGSEFEWEWYVSHEVSGHLNGRAGPGTSHAVVAQLKPGEMIDEIMERQGVWWQVDTREGKVVWVHSKFLRTRKLDNQISKDK
jgi:N-acetylmuramoyl-L-alanine amidase